MSFERHPVVGSPPRWRDTNFPVHEAIQRAEKWWNEYRGAIRQDFNHTVKQRVAPHIPGTPAVIFKTPEEPVPSGILSGNRWDDLTEQEQILITETWHHWQIREPAKLAQRLEGKIITSAPYNPKGNA